MLLLSKLSVFRRDKGKDKGGSASSVKRPVARRRSTVRHLLQLEMCEGILEEKLRAIHDYPPSLEEKFQKIRDVDFDRLDENQCVYLDYTGSMLAPKRLVGAARKALVRASSRKPALGECSFHVVY